MKNPSELYVPDGESGLSLSEINSIVGEEADNHLNGSAVGICARMDIMAQELGRDYLREGEEKGVLERIFSSLPEHEEGVKLFTINVRRRIQEKLAA